MDKRIKTQLTIDALAMAYWRRKTSAGILHYSASGSQYACNEYQKQLKRFKMIPSMSKKGNCWDNAPTERFFRSLKSEWLADYRFESRTAARACVLDFITFYNAYRLHSILGYRSPFEYEKEQLKNKESFFIKLFSVRLLVHY